MFANASHCGFTYLACFSINIKRFTMSESLLFACLTLLITGLVGQANLAQAATKVEALYQAQCAGCHEKGANRFSLSTSKKDVSTLQAAIASGNSAKGMPAFSNLAAQDILALAVLSREKATRNSQSDSGANSSLVTRTHSALGYEILFEPLAKLDGTLWSLDFISGSPLKNESPNQLSLLVTSKEGKLFYLPVERKSPNDTKASLTLGNAITIKGIPPVHVDNQGGLMEVAVLKQNDPDSWVYLSYSEPKSKVSSKALTAIARGKIVGDTWTKAETIHRFDLSFYTSASYHYGSRIALSDDYLYFSVGDRGKQDQAQDIFRPNGKVHRLRLDGTVPKNNPFVKNKKAIASIYTFGNRNPQGLAIDPQGRIWEAEHGPRGGDEINLIKPGVNYGWPKITYGINYNGTPITDKTHEQGMAQPAHYWVPSIAVSDIDFYQGELFPSWKGKLLVTGLKSQDLRLLTIANERVVAEEVVINDVGRLRDVKVHADGSIWLALNHDGQGYIARISANTRK